LTVDPEKISRISIGSPEMVGDLPGAKEAESPCLKVEVYFGLEIPLLRFLPSVEMTARGEGRKDSAEEDRNGNARIEMATRESK
jgi:hypothetical protein